VHGPTCALSNELEKPWRPAGGDLLRNPCSPQEFSTVQKYPFAYIFELSPTSAAKFRMMWSSKKTGVYKMKAVDANRHLSLCEISPESFWSDLGL
jgi:hypothetical protein